MTYNTLTPIHNELDGVLLDIYDEIEGWADKACSALDDLVELFTLRADYEWFKHELTVLFPLGIHTYIDGKLARWYAEQSGMTHIIDALIEELSLQGAGIELHRRD